MRYAVVTTLHAKGLAEYGHKFFPSFTAHWPIDAELFCFCEGFTATDVPDSVNQDPELPVRHFFDLNEECPDLVAFKERHKGEPMASGIDPTARAYNYRYDARRFAHKVFALARGLEIIESKRFGEFDYVIWLDADTLTHTPIPVAFLDKLLPAPRDIGYLMRAETFDYPECGFVIYSLKRQAAGQVIRMMRELWRTDQLFGLPEWHDSFVFQVLVKGMEAEGLAKTRSLSGGFENHEHPFINGPLGAYMDHLKGPIRKKIGHSLPEDLPGDVQPRNAYWRSVEETRIPEADDAAAKSAAEAVP